MTSNVIVRAAFVVFVLTAFAASLPAQKVSIYPNAGFFWPQHNTVGNGISADGIYGLKGGYYFDANSEIEGSFGYLNHFNLRQPVNPFDPIFGITQPATRAYLYDANYAFNFGERQFLSHRFAPYISAGVGGLTNQMTNDVPFTFVQGGGNIITPSGLIVPNPTPSKTMRSGATQFTVNYGLGVKFFNVTGPVGFRVDLRGRTLPNFYGQSTSWLEPTAGLLFSWGER
jgi:hypothetical protein